MEQQIADIRERYAGRLLTEAADMAPFLTDWRRQWTGAAWAVAQPRTTEEVAAIVRWCAERRAPIVPQGGNTSLSGGATPDANGQALLLSLTRLDRVRSVDPLNNSIVVEAGCLLAKVQEAAQQADRLFPLSLAAEGACTIGGNLATNAGGTGVLRYGNARELCLGVEIVTGTGEIWNGLRALRKDNTGYDLRDLFIGSEGTLGVITAAVLKLFPRPRGKAVAIIGSNAVGGVLEAFAVVREQVWEGLTAFEIFSHACLDLVLRHAPGARAPLGAAYPWYALIEVSDRRDETAAREVLEEAIAVAMEAGCVGDAVIAASLAQAGDFWRLREGISEAQGAEGPNIKHDIAMPISALAEFVDKIGAELEVRWPAARVGAFGHAGDGNLHFNVLAREGAPEGLMDLKSEINRFVHDAVVARSGSISAEHGLGVLRRDEAARYKSSVEFALMRTVKSALDPAGIMNPGKLLQA